MLNVYVILPGEVVVGTAQGFVGVGPKGLL